ncbi:hypothetical protein ES702_01544 [subsurface metagenome]
MKKRTRKHRVKFFRKDLKIMKEEKEKFEYLFSDVISREKLEELVL